MLAAVLGVTVLGTAAATTHPAADASVVAFWNDVAVSTIVTDAGKGNAEAFLGYAFTHAAIYNAVEGITGDYELYKWDAHARHGASPQAAAAAAGYRTLLYYYPASQPRLDTAYAASLALVPAGRARDHGIAFGERAAARIIALRTNDGRGAPITFTASPAPGVWRPTSPAPFLAPWLSAVRPLMIRSTDQFRPAPEPAMTSDRYATDFNEVKAMGSATGSSRTDAQTQLAKFFSDISIGPMQGALRDLATRHHLNISQSARLFAAADMSIADAVGAVWDAKYHYAFWRPVTAIREAASDGNDATTAVAAWVPLITTPPYPDYVSGLCGVMGALSRSVTRVLGTNHIDLNIRSVAGGAPGVPLVRHYELASDLMTDAVNARVWSGIHFRFADEGGAMIGRQVADYSLDRYFHDADD